MRRLAVIGLLLSGLLTADPTDLLQADLATVLETAAASGRHAHIAFIGEGWSMASNRFQAEVLQSAAFAEFARDHLVEAVVVSRRKPKLTKEETARLQALVIHFDIQSWPTLLVLAPDGSELLRHGYRDLSGDDYVNLMAEILGLNPVPPTGTP